MKELNPKDLIKDTIVNKSPNFMQNHNPLFNKKSVDLNVRNSLNPINSLKINHTVKPPSIKNKHSIMTPRLESSIKFTEGDKTDNVKLTQITP